MSTESVSYAIALSASAARLPIAQLGVRYKGKQRIEITRSMMASVIANFKKRDTGEVPIDYDHAIEFAAGTGGAVPAAGWIKGIDEGPDGDGILWGSVSWTEKAAGMIQAGEYKYVSPVIDPSIRDNKTGEPQGWTLTSAALTNQPVLQGMPALVLSETGWGRGDVAKEQDVVKVILADRVARTVRVVGEDGKETVMTVEGLEAPASVLRLSDVKRDAKSGDLDFASLVCGAGALVAGDVFVAMQAQTALKAAMAEGKILPAQRAVYEKMAIADPQGFETLVASMKPQVDMKVRGTGADKGEDRAPAVLVDTEVRKKITASEGKKDYATAMSEVLREQPELADAYKATLGGKK